MIEKLRYKLASALLRLASVALPVNASISMEKYDGSLNDEETIQAESDEAPTYRQVQINTKNSTQIIK